MESLAFKEIEKEAEIEDFLNRFQGYVGVRLPIDYARRSKIIGAFQHGRMVAGYMLVLSAPFRSLLFVPDRTKQSHSFFSEDPFQMMEVNGLWISSRLRNPKLQLSVWFHLVSNIFLTKRKHVLLLRDSRNTAMRRLLGLANPRLLYEGSPTLMAGEQTHSSIQVSYTRRWSILLNSYKYWLELRQRQFRANSRISKQTELSSFDPTRHTNLEPIK
ncbi:MAG: hypothetical protein KJN90_11155 [Gammaproteobacteria bacterium]|nr:hypothetical protein [Gammaproteobacteria bacterium]